VVAAEREGGRCERVTAKAGSRTRLAKSWSWTIVAPWASKILSATRSLRL
jgi:hypothetical protein